MCFWTSIELSYVSGAGQSLMTSIAKYSITSASFEANEKYVFIFKFWFKICRRTLFRYAHDMLASLLLFRKKTIFKPTKLEAYCNWMIRSPRATTKCKDILQTIKNLLATPKNTEWIRFYTNLELMFSRCLDCVLCGLWNVM